MELKLQLFIAEAAELLASLLRKGLEVAGIDHVRLHLCPRPTAHNTRGCGLRHGDGLALGGWEKLGLSCGRSWCASDQRGLEIFGQDWRQAGLKAVGQGGPRMHRLLEVGEH